MTIYKCANSESIQLRACRTITNQAQHPESCKAFIQLDIVNLVLEHLKNATEDDSITAAIRALRYVLKKLRKNIHFNSNP